MEINEMGKEKDTKIISLNGKMDAISAPDFEEKMRQWLDEGETSFIIDLLELGYISSAGLRSILVIAKELKTKGGKLMCTAPRDEVEKIFKISGFSAMIPTYESVQVALENI